MHVMYWNFTKTNLWKIQTDGDDAPVLDPPLAIYPNISHDQAWITMCMYISVLSYEENPKPFVSYTPIVCTSNSYFLELNAIINAGTFTIFKEVKRHFYLWISMTFKLFRNIDFSCVEISRVQFLYRMYANYAYELFVTFVRSSCFWMWRSLACLEPSTLGISCQGHHCIPM